MPVGSFLVILSGSFIPGLLMTLLAFLRPPEWIPDERRWRHVGVLSLLASVATCSIYGFSYKGYSNILCLLLSLVLSPLTYVFCVSLYTDLTFRKVDRWMLRLGNLIALISGVTISFYLGGIDYFVLYVIPVLMVSVLMVFQSIGQSDVRALQLMCMTSYPFFYVFSGDGLRGVQVSFVFLAMFLAIFSIIHMFKKLFMARGSDRSLKKALKVLAEKVSIPMVPFISAASLASIAFLPF